MKFLILFLTLFINTIMSIDISKDWENINLHQVIDLTGSIVRITTTIHIEQINTKPSKEYIVTLPPSLNTPVFIQAFQKDSVNGKQRSVSIKQVQNASFKVSLTEPLKTNAKTYLVLYTVYKGKLVPKPGQIAQDEQQYLEFNGEIYFYSPYASKRSKTTVRLPSDKVKSYEKSVKPVSKSSNTIVYGVYKDVPSLTSAPLSVHFYSKDAILTATNVRRIIQFSQWGQNLNFLEYFTLFHNGAKIKGQFSRIDFLLKQQERGLTNVVESLQAHLHPSAFNIIYRDDVGNVSTSRITDTRSSKVLELRPRYPLFGGWKYKWHQGYDVPLDVYLVKKSGDEYTVDLSFTPPIANLSIENLRVELILPEGAINVDVQVPFNLDSKSLEKTFTYLDTTGRPTVVLEKRNVVDEYMGPITIKYKIESWRLLQKPFALSFYILIFFLSLSLISRLDFSISKDPKVLKKEKVLKLVDSTLLIAKKCHETYQMLDDSFELFKTSKDLQGYKSVSVQVETSLSGLFKELVELSEQVASLDSDVSKSIRSLHSLYSDLYSKTRVIQAKVVEFLSRDKSDVEKKKELTLSVEQFNVAKVLLESKINKIVKKQLVL